MATTPSDLLNGNANLTSLLQGGYDPSMLDVNSWLSALKQNPQTQQSISAFSGMTNAGMPNSGGVPNSGGMTNAGGMSNAPMMPTLPAQADQHAQQNMLTNPFANGWGNYSGNAQSQQNPLLSQANIGGLLGNYYPWGQANGRWGSGGMY